MSELQQQKAPTIDSVLFQLDEMMHACCDSPLSVDSMTLTRSWRGVLEEYSAALLAERDEARSSLAKADDALVRISEEAQRQCSAGESYTYTTASEPLGIRGGQITSKRGDLCDMRDSIQRIVRTTRQFVTNEGLPRSE